MVYLFCLAAGLIIGALIQRRLGDRTPPETTVAPEACPRCDSLLSGKVCFVCNWPFEPSVAHKTPQALRALATRIARFYEAGLIDEPLRARLFEAVDRELIALGLAPLTAPSTSDDSEVLEAILIEDRPDAYEVQPQQGIPEPHLPADERSVEEILAERADRYRQQRTQAASEPIEEPSPKKPRRAFSDVLAAFMEEKHIRWGELVGGLLIVCCSIALVLSFWSEIAERPFLKFFVFNGVTAALFGVGLYTYHRWSLRTTSAGVLIIATLLVPLNFLAIAAFSRGEAPSDAIMIAGELVSIAIFATLTLFAGRIITPGAAVGYMVGVMAPSVLQLLIRRFVAPDSDAATLLMFGAAPLAFYLALNGWVLWRQSKFEELEEHHATLVLKFFGVTTFAVALPLGLLLFRTESALFTLHRLSLLVGAAGAAPLAVGLYLWRRLANRDVAALRTAAASIAVFGACMLIAGPVLAWSDPGLMIAATLTDFVIFTAVAILVRMPEAHLPAALCAAVSFVTLFYAATGAVGWTREDPAKLQAKLVSGRTGVVLVVLVVAYVAAAAAAAWRSKSQGESSSARFLGIAAAVIAVASLALATWFGFAVEGDPVGATWLYALYATAAIAAGWHMVRTRLAWAGAALAYLAAAQGVVYLANPDVAAPLAWTFAFLTHASAMAIVAAFVTWFDKARQRKRVANAISQAALASTIIAAILLIRGVFEVPPDLIALGCVWLAASWLLMALAGGSRALFAAFQAALGLALAFAAVTALLRSGRLDTPARVWFDPWTWESIGIALVAFSLAWTIAWLVLRRQSEEEPSLWMRLWHRFLNPPWPTADTIFGFAAVAILLAVATYAALPGTLQEMSPRAPAPPVAGAPPTVAPRVAPPITNFEIRWAPRSHAQGWGAWLLLFLAALLFITRLWRRLTASNVVALLVTAAAAAPLIASYWERDVAVASAWRWTSATFFILASAAIWNRAQFDPLIDLLGWPRNQFAIGKASKACIATAFILVLAPLVLMIGYSGVAATWRISLDEGIAGLMLGCLLLLALAIAGAVVMRFMAPRETQWRTLLVVLGAAPALVLGGHIVSVALRQHPIVGPDPASIFARMGTAASYSVPVLIIALTIIGHALRERSSPLAFGGGLALNIAVTAAYLLESAKRGVPLDTEQALRVALLNSIVSACYYLAWVASAEYLRRRRAKADNALDAAEPAPPHATSDVRWRLAQLAIPSVLNVAVLATTWAGLVDFLSDPVELVAGSVLGWAAVLLNLAAIFVHLIVHHREARWNLPRHAFPALLSIGVLVAATIAQTDLGGWNGYRAMYLAHIACGFAVIALAVFIKPGARGLALRSGEIAGTSDLATIIRHRRAGSKWITFTGAVAAVLAIIGYSNDPSRPWWTIFALLGVVALFATQSALAAQPTRLVTATFLLLVATTLAWADVGRSYFGPPANTLPSLITVNAIVIALSSIAWMLIYRFGVKAPASLDASFGPPAHRLAMRFAVLLMAMVTAGALLEDFAGQTSSTWPALSWLALIAIAAAAIANLWDAKAKDAVAMLYVTGFLAIGAALDAMNLPFEVAVWSGAVMMAAYAVFTSYLWSRRRGLANLAARWGMPVDVHKPFAGQRWLVAANWTLAAATMAIIFWIQFSFVQPELRLTAAQAAHALVLSVGMLARGERRTRLQHATLVLGVFDAIAFGLAFLSPEHPSHLLHCLVVVAAALAAMAIVYTLGLARILKPENEWRIAARRLAPSLVVAALAALILTLLVEGFFVYARGSAPMAWPAIVTVAIALAGLALAALAAALLPGRDPLRLSERGREAYVYGAEAIVALLFIHLRITAPWLFSGWFQQIWPLVVMFIAFLGVGFSELFRRRQQRILARPLENTGAFLPLLPVIGYWIAPARIDYSLLLFAVGALYALLAIMRRSMLFSVLAAVAANAGLWRLFNNWEGFGFLEHPQVWLIPPAVCVLIGAYLNRRELSEKQMSAIRYAASTVIYVASTADIFLGGVQQRPWLAMVLAILSIAGIFMGIMLRVRAFLFMGTSFLLLALAAIIWHAAVDLDQTWLLWVSGILLGVLILALFGLFEKRKNDLLAVLERLKEWQS